MSGNRPKGAARFAGNMAAVECQIASPMISVEHFWHRRELALRRMSGSPVQGPLRVRGQPQRMFPRNGLLRLIHKFLPGIFSYHRIDC